jgi:hypothetical protein
MNNAVGKNNTRIDFQQKLKKFPRFNKCGHCGWELQRGESEREKRE